MCTPGMLRRLPYNSPSCSLSWWFLKEKITRRRLIGNLLIIVGIVLTLTL